jgi:hypothetical protein
VLQIAARAEENSTLGFMSLLGALDPDIGWKSLELLHKTLPRLQALGQA